MLTASGPYGSRSWTYDKVGNRLSEQKIVSGTTTNQTYTYPGTSNRLASITQGGTTVRSFTYDAAGSTTGDTRSGTAYTYTINDAGRIAQLTIAGSIKANYTYDAKNRLSVRQTLNMTPAGTTHLIYDKDDHVRLTTGLLLHRSSSPHWRITRRSLERPSSPVAVSAESAHDPGAGPLEEPPESRLTLHPIQRHRGRAARQGDAVQRSLTSSR